jgi:hypothetical protein
MPTRPCVHQQAEPVILTTGERVACVCISCYAQLDRSYIEWQRKHAEIVAHCKHASQVDLAELGKPPSQWDRICTECGETFRGVGAIRYAAPALAELSDTNIGFVNIEQRMRER